MHHTQHPDALQKSQTQIPFLINELYFVSLSIVNPSLFIVALKNIGFLLTRIFYFIIIADL